MSIKVTKLTETLVKSHPFGIYSEEDEAKLYSVKDLGVVYDLNNCHQYEEALSRSGYSEIVNQDWFMINWNNAWKDVLQKHKGSGFQSDQEYVRSYMPRAYEVIVNLAILQAYPEKFVDDARYNPYVDYEYYSDKLLAHVVKSTLTSVPEVEVDQQRVYSGMMVGNILSSWYDKDQLFRVTDSKLPPGGYGFKVYPLKYTYVMIHPYVCQLLHGKFKDDELLKYQLQYLCTVERRFMTDRIITPVVDLRNNQKGGSTSKPKKQQNCSNPDDYNDLEGEKKCTSLEGTPSHDQSGVNPKESDELEL